MGSGQMLLALGAMFLLGIIIFSANSNMLENEKVVMDSEFGIAAISLATSLVEEAEGKMFDQASVDSGVTATTQLTTTAYLGKDANESYRTSDSTKTDYDDLDDFNGFFIEYVSDQSHAQIATYRGDSKGFRADYFLKAKVEYVNVTTSTITASANRTWHKRLTINVFSPSSRDTLVFPTVISYWN
ncbi:MAG TPA: hypothetical protein DGH68_03135 [Bacteroidetes bacterium]|jgi:hypothetical protein|nr:hypothetical protein [Bacteroidota bacterium]